MMKIDHLYLKSMELLSSVDAEFSFMFTIFFFWSKEGWKDLLKSLILKKSAIIYLCRTQKNV